MQLKLHDFVMTPAGKGTVVNFAKFKDGEISTVLVHIHGTENVDYNWRAFDVEKVRKL